MLPLAIFYATTVLYVVQRMDGSAFTSADCAIVFGTAVWPVYDEAGEIISSTAGPGIRRRVATAVDLLKQDRVNRLFLTGGKGEGSRKSEAQVMKEYAQQLGASANVITIESNSRSTWENLSYTRDLTSGCSSIVAISDGYHLARINLIAAIQGWPPIDITPAGNQPSIVFTARSALREAIGIDLLVLMQLSR